VRLRGSDDARDLAQAFQQLFVEGRSLLGGLRRVATIQLTQQHAFGVQPGVEMREVAQSAQEKPAPKSRTSESDTWPTTSSLPRRSRAGPALVARLLSLRTAFGATPLARSAGSNPKRIAVKLVTAAVNPSTRWSSPMSSATVAFAVERNCTSSRLPHHANSTPSAPPSPASSRLSVSNWRTRRDRPAPIARRTDSSRCRAAARASSRLATLAHAISSTSPTTAESSQSVSA
jgi:hypothetical protein